MKINEYIDHTILKPDATTADVCRLCKEALEYGFASVCVNPCHAALVNSELAGSAVKTCVVIGFPLGATTTDVKVFEAAQAVADGAREVDMVINIGALKAGDLDLVRTDIKSVADAAHPAALLKVILECCLLDDFEIKTACELCVAAGADFVKTSTGFAGGGAELSDIRLMRQTVGPDLGVKASGGIRDRESALAMIEAGANRIGTSAGVAIANAGE